MYNSTPGLDGNYYSFVAVVENINDPDNLGRVRVRCLGRDSHDLSLQPSVNLPWCLVVHSCNASKMHHDIRPEDWVTGYFMDGAAMQRPLITGVIPGIKRAEASPTYGFSKQLTDAEKEKEPVAAPGQIISGKVVDTVAGVPLLCRGEYEGTLIAQTNKDVVHVCDIATQLKRSVIWESLKHSQFVSAIRKAIEALIKALGNSPDSISQRVIELAKWLKRKLKEIQDGIKKLNDYLQITVEVARQLRDIIDWILSLPARLQAALSNCLSAFLSGIGSLLGDVLTLPSASGPDISSALSAVKETLQQAGATITAVTNTLTIPAEIADAVLTPSSVSDVSKIQSAVDSYITQQTQTNQSALNIVSDEERKLA